MSKLFLFNLCCVTLMNAAVTYLNLQLFQAFRDRDHRTVKAEQYVDEAQQSKNILEENLIDREHEIDSLKDQLRKEKAKSIELSRKLSEKVNETLTLKDDLRKRNEVIDEAQQKSDEQKKDLFGKVDALTREKDDLQARLDQLKNKLADPSASGGVVLPREQGDGTQSFVTEVVPAKKEGLVLTVNGDFNFVVGNLGKRDGLQKKQVLRIYRQNKLVGKVRVERVYDDMCSAVILSESLKAKMAPISQGDILRI